MTLARLAAMCCVGFAVGAVLPIVLVLLLTRRAP